MKDVVCGMQVDEKTAIRRDNKGKTYFFCSKNCAQAFDKNPEKFARSA